MAKTTGKKKRTALIGGVLFAMAILCLLVYLATILTTTDLFFTESAERSALVNLHTDQKAAQDRIQIHYDHLYEIVDRLEGAETKAAVDEIMTSYIGVERFGNLHYYSQGNTYSVEGSLIDRESNGEDLMRVLAQSKNQGCTPMFHDVSGYDCVAFYVPVKGSSFVDGVLSIVPARKIIDMEPVLSENDVVLIIEPNGRVLTAASKPNLLEYVGSEFYSFISRLGTDKVQVNELGQIVRKAQRATYSIDTPQGQYAVAMTPLASMNDHFLLVTIRESQSMVDLEMVYIRHIIALVAIIVLALMGGMVYYVLFRKKMVHSLELVSYTDPVLGCPNRAHFVLQCNEALKDPQRNFGVCVFELRQYKQITERLQAQHATDLLKYVAKILDTLCAPQEEYAYLGNGTYAVLLGGGSESAVKDRVRLVEAMANKHLILGKSKAKKRFNVGVTQVSDTNRIDADSLLEQAKMACELAKNSAELPYSIYDEHTSAGGLSQIETDMEASLENGEFKLFLQPKYNVAADQLDSAEALVRWFDPKTGDYRFPGEFLGLFETNGFIKKLDHFMYIEALKMLSTSAQRGEKIAPISLNVSLLTANSPDFLQFYIDSKNEYQVPDNYVVIEFAENVAAGDPEQLRGMVAELRKNGIRCSLDNFGTGASLSVLKNVPMDEVKMDRMFMRPGFDPQKDAIVQQSTTVMAKYLGMQVVQMGVENKEMFDEAVARGCDVIQGYYYAKAIPAEEYRLFMKSNTSIKYKSLVK